ncbi:MAG: hypothetical protein OXF96_05955, partial [Chloroflexi bacterium]|nr:hypothetical protein [Chloroflexota bacterium]
MGQSAAETWRTLIDAPTSAGDHMPPAPSDSPSNSSRIALVLVTTFFSGMSILAVEITASRLLAPFFGTSIIIWAVVIGLTLLYLSMGYWIGG